MSGSSRFRTFIRELTLLADQRLDEPAMLQAAKPLMSDLISNDEWLPDAFARPDERTYQQYLLHCDPLERFSLVSFVWGPGQETPIHDHTVWGLLGVLRGSETSQRYQIAEGAMQPEGSLEILESGDIDMVSPTIGDIHKVKNGSLSKPSVSIHLYGGNIGAINRHAYASDANIKTFRSGYSLNVTPNFWEHK